MGRVVNKADYTFNKTAKTITFSSTYTGLELAQIQLITDVTNSTVIYQFNKAGYGGTLVGLVLTLAYDTTGAGFNNTDNLMIIVNESQDNTVLYSGTLSNTGSISGVDTTDQQTISIQISGSWEGIVNVEGSNDNSYYVPLMVYPVNEFTLVDNIGENGIYNLTTSTKFVRLNVQQLLTGSIQTLIHGRTVDGPNAADVLSLAMDRTQNMPLNIQDVNGSPGILKKDSSNALIPADAPSTIISGVFQSGQIMAVIDTQGYQLLSVQVVTNSSFTTISPQGSNDGINWSNNVNTVLNYQSGTPSTSISSIGGVAIIQCATRYIRLPSPGNNNTIYIVCTLRQQPFVTMNPGITSGNSTNITAINGNTGPINVGNSTNTSTASSVAGLFVGGNSNFGPGSTNVAHPIIIGGRQAPASTYVGGITRTMLLDPAGRIMLGASDQTKSTTIETPLQTISNNYQNGNSLAVTDLSQFEGQNQTELLYQILLEMKIMNQYLYELPQKLNAGQNNLDEPTQFRNEPSAFTL